MRCPWGIAALAQVSAVFFYTDFNETLGLTLNGNCATSNCAFKTINEYGMEYAENDRLDAQLETIQTHTIDRVILESTDTSKPSTTGRIAADTAMFNNRDQYQPSVDRECPVRIRMTASQPHQASSFWYNDPLNVLDGFETRFTFQITDHSRRCYEVKDQNFGLHAYQSCYVHGGDGFAFVIQGNGNTTSSIGRNGNALGWEGISNSIAVVFDTWSNSDAQDLIVDNISVQASDISQPTRKLLSAPVPVELADGRIHIVKIRYYNTMPMQYFDYLTAAEDLVPHLKDIAEGRRLGCLVVFIDDGITQDVPLLALPINLAVTLRLPDDLAYIGFTAATGRAWEKHDILSWYYCAQPPCLDINGQTVALEFDYSTQTKLNTASYGTSLYPLLIFPDTEPWGISQQYYAQGVPTGVS